MPQPESRIDHALSQLQEEGFCVLKGHLPLRILQSCRDAFWPILLHHLQRNRDKPNRGEHRHFLPVPFDPPCFAPEFFFDPGVLSLVHGAMDNRVVADQWGCDVPVQGSTYQEFHLDYQRPLFPEVADLTLPTYMLVVNFGLIDITPSHGPIEIAPGTHKLPRAEALRAVMNGERKTQPVPLGVGDVLIRHPWILHRGTPNTTSIPRALLGIRYVRRWYADHSREVATIPLPVWQLLTPEQQSIMRFPCDRSPS